MGKKNIVGIGGNFHPNFVKFDGVQSFIAIDLNIEYERVMNRNFSMGLEYNLQPFRLPTKGKFHKVNVSSGFSSTYIDSYFSEDFSMVAHHIDLNFHLYRGKGSIAPFGSFITYQIGIVKTKAIGKEISKELEYSNTDVDVDIAPANLTLIHFGFELMNKRSLGNNLLLKYGIGINANISTVLKYNIEDGYLINVMYGAFRETFQSNITIYSSDLDDSKEYSRYIEKGAFARLMALNILNFKVVLELPF